MITGIGSTVAETFVAAATSVADAVASFTAAMAVTSTVAEASTAVTHSAAAVATSMAEEAFMVDTVGADPMVAVMAVDTGKFLDSSTPPHGRQHALPAVSFFEWTRRETRDQEMRSSWLRNWRGRISMRRR
jgi:hypothetical protein